MLVTADGHGQLGGEGDTEFSHAGRRELKHVAEPVDVYDVRRPFATQHSALGGIRTPNLLIRGIEATRTITARYPDTKVVVLTMTGDDEAVFAALAAGAAGYLLKGADRPAIIGAVEAVSRGEAVLGAGVAAKVLHQFSAPRTAPLPELSDREREVLALVADGLTNVNIAERLFLSPKTVRNHVSNILT